jgi:hypothetical protein
MPQVNALNEARDVLSGIVKTAWDDVTSAPLLYDNIKGTRPETRATFGRVVVRHFDGNIAALGTTFNRLYGALYVQLFTPEGAGTAELDEIADALVKALVAATPGELQGIRLSKVTVLELGVDPSDRQYHQVNVQAAFQYDTRS